MHQRALEIVETSLKRAVEILEGEHDRDLVTARATISTLDSRLAEVERKGKLLLAGLDEQREKAIAEIERIFEAARQLIDNAYAEEIKLMSDERAALKDRLNLMEGENASPAND